MQGTQERQASMLALVSMESRVPKDHPIRRIKGYDTHDIVTLLLHLIRAFLPLPRHLGYDFKTNP
jgi:hypothetical protein